MDCRLREGSLSTLVTTPLRPAEYLLSTVLTLAALALLDSLAIGLWLTEARTRWSLLLTGCALLACLYTLGAFLAIVRYPHRDPALPSRGAWVLSPSPMHELKSILAAHAAGAGPGALATVVTVQGSAYRRPGARFYLAADGATAGSLSSGCLEDEVAELGRRVLATGRAELAAFDLRPRFGCAGAIEVLLERIAPASPFFAALAEVLTTRRARTIGVVFRGDPAGWGSRPAAADGHDLRDEILPPVQLVLVGDSLDSAALAGQARLLGWEVALAETAAELPPLDDRTAVVVKAHKLGRDFAALRALLGSPAFYLGLVGPARRRRELLGLLYDEGAVEPGAPLPQVFGPSGLDIGGETPAEVALSICAEIQAVLGGHAGGPLRLKPAGIHQRHAPAG